MALFSDTPEAIQDTFPEPQGANIARLLGPFANGDIRYVGGVMAGQAVIAKRSSSGVWSFPDISNAPSHFSTPLSQFLYDQTAGIIYILTRTASPNFFLRCTTFDVVSETYGSQVTSTLPVNLFRMGQRSDSSLIIAFGGANVGDDFKYVEFSGGSFGSAGTLVAGSANLYLQPLDLLVDVDDNAHIAYHRIPSFPTPAPTTYLDYLQLSAGNFPGTPANIDSGANADLPNFSVSPGLMWTDQDQILWLKSSWSMIPADVVLYVGSPIASPTWTPITITTLTDQYRINFAGSIALTGTNAYLFWANNAINGVQVVHIDYAIYNGSTLTIPDAAWDVLANKPPAATGVPNADFDVSAPSITAIGANLEMVAETEVNEDEDSGLCYLVATPGPGSGSRNRLY